MTQKEYVLEWFIRFDVAKNHKYYFDLAAIFAARADTFTADAAHRTKLMT